MLQAAFYLLKVILCSGILLGYYWCMLRNKLYHHYNRFFLLASVVLSLVLPLVKINIHHHADTPPSQAIQLIQAVTSSDEFVYDMAVNTPPDYFSATQLMTVVYFIVSLILLAAFIRVLWIIRGLIYKYRGQVVERFFFVNTDAKGTPFSFLNYIFWNDAIDIESTTGRQIFRHEVAHVQEKHSLDKLFINLLLVLFWSNPFFWLIRREINMIHEFIADKKAVEDNDTASFAAMILQAAYPRHRFELTNNFFYSPIKRRLLMLTKKQHPKVSYFSRILVLPLAALVVAAFTFKAKTIVPPLQQAAGSSNTFVVVIDAGHGGQDNGSMSAEGMREKDLSLALAQKVKELNTDGNIEIVLTRSTDVYLTPQERVAFAKSKQASLLVSLHMDAEPGGGAAKIGMAVFIARNEFPNSAASRQLASAIISEFSNNYSLAVTRAPQQRKTGIWLLQASECPSVIVEAGYMTSRADAAYLNSDAGREVLARNLLSAIGRYLRQPQRAAADTIPLQPAAKQQPVTAAPEQRETQVAENDIYSIGSEKINVQLKKNGTGNTYTIVQPVNAGAARPQVLLSSKEAQPLYVLNGQLADAALLKSVSPDNIASVNVLKGENALAVYGEKGRNGVVEILTKNSFAITAETIPSVNTDGNQQNVLYIGVPNHLRIRSPQIPAGDFRVGVENGAISDSKGSYIVTVSSIGTAVITVYDKKGMPVARKAFTVKRIPDLPYAAAHEQTPTAMLAVEQDYADPVFTKVEKEAQFPGGADGWRKYLVRTLDAGVAVKEGWKQGTYTITVQFITDKEGRVSEVSALNYKGSKTAQHCMDIIRKGPQWEPAVQNGHKVKAYRRQPITFIIN